MMRVAEFTLVYDARLVELDARLVELDAKMRQLTDELKETRAQRRGRARAASRGARRQAMNVTDLARRIARTHNRNIAHRRARPD